MSKLIYENAIKTVTYLQEQNSHQKDNSRTIYVSTENITALENLLIHSQKQARLLKLYREKEKYSVIAFLPKVELDKYRNIVEQIKELENEN